MFPDKLAKLKKPKTCKMHQIVKPDETTVASVEVGAIRGGGRPPGKLFKDQFWKRLFSVISSSLDTQSQEHVNHNSWLHKLRAITCTKEDQNIRWKQLWHLKGYSNRKSTNARAYPEGLITISTEIWKEEWGVYGDLNILVKDHRCPQLI